MERKELEANAAEFLNSVGPYLGRFGVPNHTFYSYQVVSSALAGLRIRMEKGQKLNDQGKHFLKQAMSYLALVILNNWERRGLEVSCSPDPKAMDITIRRGGILFRGSYTQHLSADAPYIIHPPAAFPYCHDLAYRFKSLMLPTPEYLYTYGACLLDSPHATGKWPNFRNANKFKPGGKDFGVSHRLLVDDLHTDCGLPMEDKVMRGLSESVVYPAFGWVENDGGKYNLMKLFTAVSHEKRVPLNITIDYLRQLLASQDLPTRNFAARALMVYRTEPRNPEDAYHYMQAMGASDYKHVENYLYTAQWIAEGKAPKGKKPEPDPKWVNEVRTQRQAWTVRASELINGTDPILKSPLFEKIAQHGPKLSVEEVGTMLVQLETEFPSSPMLHTMKGIQLLRSKNESGGEVLLLEQATSAGVNCEAYMQLVLFYREKGNRELELAALRAAIQKYPLYAPVSAMALDRLTENMAMTADDMTFGELMAASLPPELRGKIPFFAEFE